MCETEFSVTKFMPIYDPGVHTGTPFLLKPKAKATMQGKQALFTHQGVEQSAEDRRTGARLVTLKKRVHVVDYIVDKLGVRPSLCLMVSSPYYVSRLLIKEQTVLLFCFWSCEIHSQDSQSGCFLLYREIFSHSFVDTNY